jgi:RimJ/RimL family protein N-acetyltransferase
MIISPKQVSLKNGNAAVLRSPRPEEAQKLLDHLKNVFRQSYRNMNFSASRWDGFPAEEEAKIIAEFAGDSTKFMLSAFVGDRIVGNLGLFGAGGEFQQFNARIGMGLEVEFQNLGLGTALLNYSIQTAQGLKMHRLDLTVRSFNEGGIALYEKVGFRRVGILKEVAFIDGKFWDEYIYEKLLDI